MRRKYKLTGCARFFIVMIILAPLAYLAASYYNGQDGIQNIKNLLGIESSEGAPSEPATNTTDDVAPAEETGTQGTAPPPAMERRLQMQDSLVNALQEENTLLKKRIEQLEELLKVQEQN